MTLRCGAWGIYVRMAVASAMNKSVRYPVKPYGIKKEQEMDSATIKEKILAESKGNKCKI